MVSETISIYGRNFIRLFPVYLVVGLVTTVVTSLVTLWLLGYPRASLGFSPAAYDTVGPANLLTFLAAAIIATSAGVALSALVTGGVAHYAVQYRRRIRESYVKAMVHGIARFPRVLSASAVAVLLPELALLLPFYVFSLASADQNAALLGVSVAILAGTLVVTVYFTVVLSLFLPALMMEGLGALGSLRRSWRLTVGWRGVIFGSLFLLAILAAILTVALSQPAVLSGSIIVEMATQAIAQGVVGSWTVIAVSVVYDQVITLVRPRG